MSFAILVALDGSRNAERALPLVEPVLKEADGKAVLLQVLPPGSHSPEAAAKAYLREVCGRLKRRKIEAVGGTAVGDPALTLIRAAERSEISLVAFTSHGEGGLERWVFGSVAQKILRGCPKPLLLVRTAQPEKKFARVVVPLDGSAGCEAVLPLALRFARAHGASVVLLYVANESGVEADNSKLRGWLEREKRRNDARFAEIQNANPDLRFERVIEEGDPAVRILACAEASPDSLIAIGSRGRSGLSRFMFGSVTEKLLQASRCAMLVVRR
jgi:nucleotide-binding universal stress UspA family protein